MAGHRCPNYIWGVFIICSHWSKNSSWTHHSVHTALRSWKTCALVKTHFPAWPSLAFQQPWTWRPHHPPQNIILTWPPGHHWMSSEIYSLAGRPSLLCQLLISLNYKLQCTPAYRSLLPQIALTHYFIYHQWLPECLSLAWMSFLTSRFIYTTFFTSPLPCLIEISTTTSWKDLILSIPYSRVLWAPTDNSLMRYK